MESYWDSTGNWRLTYFDWLKNTPDEKLTFVLRAEKEVAITEEKVLNRLLKEGANDILELGCGVGRSIIKEISLYPEKRFVGVDISSYQIELFQKQISKANALNAKAVVCDAGDMHCLEGSFDLIVMCNHTFGNFLGETRIKALSEMCRLLTANGKILLSGFSNIDIAKQCYAEWGVKIEKIDYKTGLCKLKDYNSLWQKQEDTNKEFFSRGFEATESIPTTLGFVNVYKRIA
ncbi:MAG: class I SAM-dependent methyltransferase [Clostridiales bacterium]|nr:class I SAM-dependent methyltransferase [Clostridiales bacterium]